MTSELNILFLAVLNSSLVTPFFARSSKITYHSFAFYT